MRFLVPLALACLAAAPCAAAEATPSHGLSVFGDLKYGPDFTHFDYVNPQAPKGGAVRRRWIGSYDTLNPYTLKGLSAIGVSILFPSLMTPAADEADSLYGLLAASVEVPADRSWVAFNLRPEARWHDGSPITAADVVFSYEILITKGHPRFRLLYRDFVGAVAPSPGRVRFDFKQAVNRDLPLLAATMPVFSKAYFGERDFAKTTLEPPLGGGPYSVAKVDPGRSITFERVKDYWGRDLPVNRGRHNFDIIRYDYYRDRNVALEAFFAGEYDFREEYTSKSWASQYDKPAVRDGRIVREVLPDDRPSGTQAFFLNLRRDKFKDRRVREALALAFDFAWTNKNIFYGAYERMGSVFENFELAAHAPPDAAELALLEPLKGQIPEEVFTTPYQAPGTGSALRKNLRRASKLLNAAGWKVAEGVRANAAGEKLKVEFLTFAPTFERVINPYIRNLERIGVTAKLRIIDLAQYKRRLDDFDFDIVTVRHGIPLTPGVEQREFWGSIGAGTPGGLNFAGIADPAVDALIEEVIAARTRPELIAASRALDRVLMWNHYLIPQWYKGEHHIAYWNTFSRPALKPKYAPGYMDTWWYDEGKAAQLARIQGD
jgi:microcin C transport system substrate-binding protein